MNNCLERSLGKELVALWNTKNTLNWTKQTSGMILVCICTGNTLGCIDIMGAVMTMCGFRYQPRIGHLDRLKRIFGFLRNYKSCSIKFRTEEPDYSTYKSVDYDWTNLYGDIQEEISNNMPRVKG